jgi:hypothetical protein
MTLASPWTGPSCASNAGFAPMATPALDLLAVRTKSGHVRLDDRSAHWDGAVEPALAALGGQPTSRRARIGRRKRATNWSRIRRWSGQRWCRGPKRGLGSSRSRYTAWPKMEVGRDSQRMVKAASQVEKKRAQREGGERRARCWELRRLACECRFRRAPSSGKRYGRPTADRGFPTKRVRPIRVFGAFLRKVKPIFGSR